MRVFSYDNTTFVLRYVIGGLFVYAGALKAIDFSATMQAVENFHLVPHFAIPLVAILLPAIEICAGGMLLFKVHQKFASLVIAALILVFCVALISGWVRGLDISCGCFGKSDQTTNYPWSLFRNFMMLASLFLIFLLSEYKIARRYY